MTPSNPGHNYNYSYDYSIPNPSYAGYNYPLVYQMPPVRRKRRKLRLFMLLAIAGLLVAAFNLAQNHLQPGGPTVAGEGSGFGFTIQPNDPLYNEQYALKRLNAEEAWKITTGSPGVIVAVIDTGVDANHPDLKGKLVRGYDFINNTDKPDDSVGHGTFVASLIAASGDNGKGIVGLAPDVRIMPLKVLDRQGGGDSLTIARAIRYAADNGAKVINLSLGGPFPSRSIKQAVDYAAGRGVVVVASAGNDGSRGNPVEYPAAFSNVISVGATGPGNKIVSFSTHNEALSVAAPGVNVFGARSSKNSMCRPYDGQPYFVSSGTSFSAPYVSATAALMLSANPKLSPAEVNTILARTATDLGPKGADEYYGAGLVNTARAVAASKQA